MKIVSIVGARPQFVKAGPISKELRSVPPDGGRRIKEILVHTGQHYDQNMSPIFFKELSIPKPDYNLGIGSGGHGEQTGKMLIGIERLLLKERPDMVLVYGDTNSTAAGALAAAKLHIPVAHVEAGLRSYKRDMPEEINRIIADHLSELLFCPTESAVENLKKEGIIKGVYNVGDVMCDALLINKKIANQESKILKTLNLPARQTSPGEAGGKPKTYLFATIHRAENTDEKKNLENIFEAFEESGETIILPLHPRTKKMIAKFNIKVPKNVQLIEPVGYLDSLQLQSSAKKVLTDSGGVQKEAYLLGVPCITLRAETEWVETVEGGWNTLVGTDKEEILRAIKTFKPKNKQRNLFGTGDSASQIADLIEKF